MFCKEFPEANNTDSDQTPRSAASDFGLHCLHMSPRQVSSLKQVKAQVDVSRRKLLILMRILSVVVVTSWSPA